MNPSKEDMEAENQMKNFAVCNNDSNLEGEKSAKNFTQKTKLYSVHEGKQPIECGLCARKFTLKRNFHRHLASVHEGKKPFKCDICNMKFAHRQTLIRHELTHGFQGDIECGMCDKTFFAQKCDLDRHIARFHAIENPFKCDLCAKQFAHRRNLNLHVGNVHKKKKGKRKKVKKVNIQNETLSEIEIEEHPLEVKSEPLEVNSESQEVKGESKEDLEAGDQMKNFVVCNNDPNIEVEAFSEMKDPLTILCNVKTEEPEFQSIETCKNSENNQEG